MADEKPTRVVVKEGHVPLKKGFQPKVTPSGGDGKVQGGYVPTTSQGGDNPPTGGSGGKK